MISNKAYHPGWYNNRQEQELWGRYGGFQGTSETTKSSFTYTRKYAKNGAGKSISKS
ncbi:hypothetical protein JOC86_000285 [Bacillus pakistanensis]|uniref:Uncharacterized protein n=1 Tax=Rossellomorea pakistanensis TaxID=992288 RepID=A0ABS2N7D3_9BACI|nr:hypothetical protein [Bacillus pakistanensis]MBM7583748.1 hypothetical protein [Bacillus pakistanensis]